MTVKELISVLETLEGGKQVFVATDEEGNGYGAVSPELEEAVYEDGEGEKDVYIIYPSGFVNPDDIS
ncbi:hypothetical protein [Bauldia litoralis]